VGRNPPDFRSSVTLPYPLVSQNPCKYLQEGLKSRKKAKIDGILISKIRKFNKRLKLSINIPKFLKLVLDKLK
jgi:hypothetical protein